MPHRPNTAFTKAEVAKIKRDLLEGKRRKDIARAYEVGLETIARIARGDTWGDIQPASNAHIDKFEAEILAPANIEGISERLLRTQSEIPPHECPHCKSGVPKRKDGQHEGPYGMIFTCG